MKITQLENFKYRIYSLPKKKRALIIIFALFALVSCDDFVSVPAPTTRIITPTVYESDAVATAAVRGLYSEMVENTFTGLVTSGSAVYSGWSSDEFLSYGSDDADNEFFSNSLVSTNPRVNSFWSQGYLFIYYSNAIIEGLAQSADVTPSVKAQLEGEAKFVRALMYFYMVNFFGDVPVVTTTDYRTNSSISRAPSSQVYDQIVSDLLSAKELLPEAYATSERARPNKFTAIALLARVYLYREEWVKAENESTLLIDNVNYSLVEDLSSVFLKESTETIWQLMPVAPDLNANAGENFILSDSEIPEKISLSDALIESFEPDDARLTNWVGAFEYDGNTYYYPFKYKVKQSSEVTEYNVVFRLSEQYLIRAEARIRQEKINEGIQDINSIRGRAGLEDLSEGLSQDQALDHLIHERKIELFSEGHRWFDLKRTNLADIILDDIKTNWESTDALYPIPQAQILNDPAMAKQQNPGY